MTKPSRRGTAGPTSGKPAKRVRVDPKTASNPQTSGDPEVAAPKPSVPWSEIRSTYEGSALPVSAIAKAYAVNARLIYERAAREQWAARRARPRRPTKPAGDLDRTVLVARLFRAVERQIDEIDRRFRAMDGVPVDEKEARTLAALARTIELLIGLERQARPEPKETPEADIDAFRRDLARRIASLQATGED